MTTTPVEHLLENQGWIRALCKSLVRDPHHAEDAGQDTWVRALESGPSEPRALKQWLRTVAINAVFQRGRRDAARREREERSESRPAELPSPAKALEKASMRRHIVESVLSLEEPYRTTIVLRYFEELSTEDVAVAQNCTTSTVRSQTQRAIEKLRRKLESQYKEREHVHSLDGILLLLAMDPPSLMTASAGAVADAGTRLRSFARSTATWTVAAAVVALALVWWIDGGNAVRGASSTAVDEAAVRARLQPPPEAVATQPVLSVKKADPLPKLRAIDAGNGAPISEVEVRAGFARPDANRALLPHSLTLGRTNLSGELTLRLPKDALEFAVAQTELTFEHPDYLAWQIPPREMAQYAGEAAVDVPLYVLGSLDVVIEGPDGSPLPEHVLRARPLIGRGRSAEATLLQSGRTDTTGTATLTRLPCGVPLEVTVSADGGGDGFSFLRAEHVIEPASRHGRLLLKAPWTGGVIGTLAAGDGSPLVGHPVSWFGPVAVGETESRPRVARTDESGRFEFLLTRVGEGVLAVEDGPAPMPTVVVAGERTDVGTLVIEVEAHVAGTVQPGDGVELDSPVLHLFADGRLRTSLRAELDGSFRLPSPAGEVQLVVTNGSGGSWGEDRVLANVHVIAPVDDLVVAVTEGEPAAEARTLRPASLDLLVVDGDGTPVPGATISFGANGASSEPARFLTDADGRVWGVPVTPPGVSLRAEHLSVGVSPRTEIEVASGASEQATLTLQPHAHLRIRVEGTAGPVRGAAGRLAGGGTASVEWSTDADGMHSFPPLPPGPYRLWWNGTFRQLDLEPGLERELVLLADKETIALELYAGGARASWVEGGFLLVVDPASEDYGVAARAQSLGPGIFRVRRPEGRAIFVASRIGPTQRRVHVLDVGVLQGESLPLGFRGDALTVERAAPGPPLRLRLESLAAGPLPQSFELDYVFDKQGRQVFPAIPAGATLVLDGIDGTLHAEKEVAFPAEGSATVSWP